MTGSSNEETVDEVSAVHIITCFARITEKKFFFYKNETLVILQVLLLVSPWSHIVITITLHMFKRLNDR